MTEETLPDLASCHRCVERIRGQWPTFVRKRNEWLAQQQRYGAAAEKVAENILQVLLTEVLDWEVPDLNHQVGYADLLLTRLGIKYLLLEVKRPDALAWHRRAMDQALDQALRYAGEQKVRCIGVSDGTILYAADVVHGGTRPRLFVQLDGEIAPEQLWWLSVHGVYREAPAPSIPSAPAPPGFAGQPPAITESFEDLHPKYRVPARCFAYVGNAADHATWKLPYLLGDGSVDGKRLPKAIGAILSNYRGVKVSGIPEKAIPDVLVRLAQAACSIGKLPKPPADPAHVYGQLANVLEQLGRVDDVRWS